MNDIVDVNDYDLLTKLDNIFIAIDSLNEKELEEVVKYIEDQKFIVKISEKRREKLRNEMRIERIKMRKELNNENKKKIIKQKEIEDQEESSEEEQMKVSKKSKGKK